MAADRFESGWSVYAPVDVDESDPLAFLDMPVGRSVFLVGDSGRIEEVSSSVPPQFAHDEFTARERATGNGSGVSGPEPGAEGAGGEQDDVVAEQAARLIDPIVQQLALLGPSEWEWLWAEFAFTVSAEIAHLRFASYHRTVVVPVPEPVAALVRGQRDVAARMSAGPWWRLLLTVTNRGETTVNYDYGDGPFPHDQLLPPEDYRADLEAYPRPRVPAWLTRYIEGPDA
ncbi:hypothetical protein OHR68_03340 [Spirillospora sp. NBC_00431]